MAHREKTTVSQSGGVESRRAPTSFARGSCSHPMAFTSLAAPRTATIVPGPLVAVDHAEIQAKPSATCGCYMQRSGLPRSSCTTYCRRPVLAQALLLTSVNASAVVAAIRAALRTSRLNRLVWVALAASRRCRHWPMAPTICTPSSPGMRFTSQVRWTSCGCSRIRASSWRCLPSASKRRGGHQGDPARRRHHDRRRRNADVAVRHRSKHPGAWRIHL